MTNSERVQEELLQNAYWNGNWKRDNANLHAAITAYINGSTRPSDTPNHYGQAMILLEDMIREENPAPSPGLSPIAPPQGNLTQRSSGVFVRNFSEGTSPGVVQNVHVTKAPDYGVLVMQWPPQAWNGRYTVKDCLIENVVLPPFDTEGFNEAALWAGQTGDYYRLILKNAEWMSAFTGSRCANSNFYDIQAINQPYVGFYPEHVTANCKFYRINIECAQTCFNSEWWYASAEHGAFAAQQAGINTNGRAGSFGHKVYDVRMRTTSNYSVFLDAGTFGSEFGVDGYMDANKPMVLPRRLQDPNRPNIVKQENINWNGIPENQRVQYHDNALGIYKKPRFSFGLRGYSRIENVKSSHPGAIRKNRDWDKLARELEAM